MTITPEMTAWAQAHVFHFIGFIGVIVALFALRAAIKGASR